MQQILMSFTCTYITVIINVYQNIKEKGPRSHCCVEIKWDLL